MPEIGAALRRSFGSAAAPASPPPPTTRVDPGASVPPSGASGGARVIGLVLVLAAGVVAAVAPHAASAFMPGSGFALFAGFYVAAQAIERLLEFVVPSGNGSKEAKADRALIVGGLATLLGVILSLAVGLYFLRAVGGMGKTEPPVWLDIFVTGLVIGGGTKPLHDLIGLIQKAS